MATGNESMQIMTGSGWSRGLDNLLNGEFTHWFRTRTLWTAILIWFSCTNLVYLMASLAAGDEMPPNEAMMIFSIMMSLAGPIGVTITMQGAVVGEKRSGTAAWVLSKPVSRPAFILSKLIGNTAGITVTLVLVQGLIAYGITYFVFGIAPPIPGYLAALGVLLVNTLFYLTLTLMLGAVLDHPAPVVAIPMGFFFVQQFIANSSPLLMKILPWSLSMPSNEALPISAALMTGAPVATYAPLISTLIYSAIFVVVALWVFQRQEL